MFMDFISYEINGKKANSRCINDLINKFSLMGGGIWIWDEFDKFYCISKQKIYAVSKDINFLLSMTHEFPSSKTQVIDIPYQLITEYLKMARRRRATKSRYSVDENDHNINKKIFISELKCCKEIGNVFYKEKLHDLALVWYLQFFAKTGLMTTQENAGNIIKLESSSSNIINLNKSRFSRINKEEMAKICNNISACLFIQQKYNRTMVWCTHALYFNDKYEKVKKRIKNVEELLINDID